MSQRPQARTSRNQALMDSNRDAVGLPAFSSRLFRAEPHPHPSQEALIHSDGLVCASSW